jgi:hypothetical protein
MTGTHKDINVMFGACISMKAKGALRWQHSFWGSTRPEHYYSRWIVRYVEASRTEGSRHADRSMHGWKANKCGGYETFRYTAEKRSVELL